MIPQYHTTSRSLDSCYDQNILIIRSSTFSENIRGYVIKLSCHKKKGENIGYQNVHTNEIYISFHFKTSVFKIQ